MQRYNYLFCIAMLPSPHQTLGDLESSEKRFGSSAEAMRNTLEEKWRSGLLLTRLDGCATSTSSRWKRPANLSRRLFRSVLIKPEKLLGAINRDSRRLVSDKMIGTTQLMVTVLAPWVKLVALAKGARIFTSSCKRPYSLLVKTRFSCFSLHSIRVCNPVWPNPKTRVTRTSFKPETRV